MIYHLKDSIKASAQLVGLIAALSLSFSIIAEEIESHSHPTGEESTAKEKRAIPEPTAFVTQHSGVFNDKKINYTVTAGETYLQDKDGKPKASIFSFAYTKKGPANANRPVTFVWNGGPGSASVWLHIGSFGPKRVSVPSNAQHPGPPPYTVLTASEAILDVTDLVFVDPVGTGFSSALGEHENSEFWGLNEDAESMAEFIRDWSTANGRWNTPKFLLGESFGTTRAAAVADILQSDMGISLNGLIFVSQALDYAGSSPYMSNNLISYITYLPTMAAAALHHKKISPEPINEETFLRDARTFATDELLPALFKGNQLNAEQRKQLAQRLAWFTGLSPDYVERANLRVNGFSFAKELLREQGLALGLLDARYTRDDIDDLESQPESDAAGDAISGAFQAAMRSYMHNDLKIDWNRLYKSPSDDELGNKWRWRTAPDDSAWEPWPVNTAGDLVSALRVNPSLKVMVASGYHDLVTPFFDAEYTLNRHGIKQGRVEYHYYTGGHMMYVHEPSRTDLLYDVRAFIKRQTAK